MKTTEAQEESHLSEGALGRLHLPHQSGDLRRETQMPLYLSLLQWDNWTMSPLQRNRH